MQWKSSFSVLRMQADGNLKEVFGADDIQKAKYWLSYIAEVGDLLVKTPAHPKNSSGQPQYWSHKEQTGQAVTSKEGWMNMHSISDFDAVFRADPA